MCHCTLRSRNLSDLPQLAKMLIVSPDFKCSNEILTIVSMLSGTDLVLPSKLHADITQCPTSGCGQTTNARKRTTPKLYSRFRTGIILPFLMSIIRGCRVCAESFSGVSVYSHLLRFEGLKLVMGQLRIPTCSFASRECPATAGINDDPL